ncbi:MAG: PEGA domain-containing protein [Deltaproteobacteria bacterium]
MTILYRLALLGLLTLGGLAPGAARAATRVAVYPLQPLGLPAATVESLDATLRGRISQLPGLSLLGREPTLGALSAGGDSASGLHCDGGPACLAALGRRLGVDEVVYGVASGLGARTALDLKLVDVATGGEKRRVHAIVGRAAAGQGGRSPILGGLREAAVRLLDPAAWTGALEVLCEIRGAQVSVDGTPRGQTPLEPIAGIVPGRHSLRVTKAGYSGVERFVDVRFDETAELKVDLAGNAVGAVMYREGTAPGHRGVVIVSEGGALAARPGSERVWGSRLVVATVALATLGLGAGLASSIERGAAANMARPVAPADEGLLNQRVGRAAGFGLAADVLWIAAGASLVSAGVVYALSGSGTKGMVSMGVGPGGIALAGSF